MQSPHAMLRLLEAKRRETHTKLGHRPMGVAACDVLDELIRRVRAVTDGTAENAPLTLSELRQFPDIFKTIQSVMATMYTMFEVMVEGGEAVEERRQPLLRFVDRLRCEGYQVANNFTVTAAGVTNRSRLVYSKQSRPHHLNSALHHRPHAPTIPTSTPRIRVRTTPPNLEFRITAPRSLKMTHFRPATTQRRRRTATVLTAAQPLTACAPP